MDSIRKRRKELEKSVIGYAPERDGNGRVIVRMGVTDDSSFLSPYSAGDRVISGEVADFLQNATAAIRPKESLHINIESDVIDGEEQKIYGKAIANYFTNAFSDITKKKNRLTFIAVIMTAIAVAVLSLMIILTALNANGVFVEIIDILGWVFMWEAVDLFFIQRSALKIEQLRYLAFIDAEISFAQSAVDN